MFSFRDFGFQTVFYETVDEVDKYLTVAVVKNSSDFKKVEDLKGKRVCFPEYDGVAWNSVIAKLHNESMLNTCSYDEALKDFFSEICFSNSREPFPENMGKRCMEGFDGDLGALHCLNEDYGDVAFMSKNSLEQFRKGTVFL